MKVIKNNLITTFDCDGTLILYNDPKEPAPNKKIFNYGDTLFYLTPHKMHIAFLKHCFNRGDYVVVWSKNGWQWAEKVVKILEIEKYVHLCQSKPKLHVDDCQTLIDIVGENIYLKDFK